MSTRHSNVMTLKELSPKITGLTVATSQGLVNRRVVEIQRELKQGVKKPFQQITACQYGDLHAMGQKPITFVRQVSAICAYPELLNSASLPEDAKQRAKGILQELSGSTIGAYNVEFSINNMPRKVAKFIERRDGGIPANPSNIIISTGASEAILSVLTLAISEEEPVKTGVMVGVPQFPLYINAIVNASAVMVQYYLEEENEWALNVQEIRRSLNEARAHCNPRILCIVNPGNPTGQVQSRRCIEEVIQLAAEENLLLFADEVYQDNVLAPGCQFHSFKKVLFEMGPKYSERVQLVSIHSVSKGFAGECGQRCGYIEYVNIDEEILSCLHQSAFSGHPPVVGMIVMDCVLNPPIPGETSYETFIAEKQEIQNNLAAKARLAEAMLNQAPGICCNPIQGSMYAFPRFEIPEKAVKIAQAQGQKPDEFFCLRLLEETGVAVAPGSAFGQAKDTYHFRITLIHPEEKMEAALSSIKSFHAMFLQMYS